MNVIDVKGNALLGKRLSWLWRLIWGKCLHQNKISKRKRKKIIKLDGPVCTVRILLHFTRIIVDLTLTLRIAKDIYIYLTTGII